jgi:3-hydroxypropionyl-CoA synthetase (ADP-forming)
VSNITNPDWKHTVETILQKAADTGRGELYEHEVYKILEVLDLRTPRHYLITEAAEISRELLSSFGSSRVVMKVVSPALAHKANAGGVRILHKDLDFVRYSCTSMIQDFRQREIPVEGVLLAEYIDYSPELGNETLIGFRESETFGPVISFSKGGSDAEHFAAHFSPPNLVLPPLSPEWARALLSSTEIHKKFLTDGKQEYIEQILDTKLKFSELATAFSNFFPTGSHHVITEFEINPFVFDRDGQMIALDGYAVFAEADLSAAEEEASQDSVAFRNLEAFFKPEGVAVVGVSATDQSRPGNIIASNLLRLERDDIYCVNPRGGAVNLEGQELLLFRSLKELPQKAELVIVTVPAAAAVEVVRDAAAAGCRAVLLIPGGFSETSHDRGPEEEMLSLCREKGIRIMGPNCLGVVYAGGERNEKGLNTFFIPQAKFQVDLSRDRNMALFSQSGALGLVELTELRQAVSPKVVVSYGNQLDVGPCDLIRFWGDDPEIRVIGVYIEGFKSRDGRRFFNIASRGLTDKNRVPIVVYKAGRTQEGQRATQSHTASIAGEYAVAKAAMKQAGLIVAETMAQHQGFIKIFAMLHDSTVGGNRVAVITNAGYEKANAADNLGTLVPADLDEATQTKLREILPPFVTVETMLDLTPMVGDEIFVKAVDLLLASDAVDSLLISIVPHTGYLHTTDAEIEAYPENIAAGIVATAARYRKPLTVSITATSGTGSAYNTLGTVLEQGGVPVYRTAEEAVGFLNEFVRYHLIREQNRLEEWIR